MTRDSDTPGSGSDTLDSRALELFAASLEQPQAQRQAWLERECEGSDELLERVEQLARADHSGGGFLESSPLSRISIDRIGEQLGVFEVTGELASGGMSTVYRARRMDGAFEQDVAIKLFRADLMSADAFMRFEAERRILASLEHPGIARIIDGGSTADGIPYVVMELVDGEPITRFCASSELDVESRLRLVLDLCNALQVAHSRGIVHRDIKPGNVLVDSNQQVRLIDFGIAKRLESQDGEGELPRTRMNLQMYTPEYASPEQVRGETVGIVSDVYSLGVLMYELLTGQRPYSIESLTPAGIERTISDTIPADPSHIASSDRGQNSGLPGSKSLQRTLRGDLDRIVMTALHKDSEHRYASATALAEDIERYLNGHPVKARGASMTYRLKKFVQRHPGATGATLLTVITLVGALVVVSQQALEARRQADRAESAKQFLVDMIGRSDPYLTAETMSLATALQHAIPTIGEQFSQQPLLEAEMRYAIGFALSGLGEISAAREQLERALEIYRPSETPVETARVMNALAGVAWDESDYVRAEQLYTGALELLEGNSGVEAAQARFNVLIDLGGLLPKMDQPDRSIEILKQALEFADANAGIEFDTVSTAVLWNNLATAYDELEDYESSIAAYEKSIALHRQARPEGSPDLASALANMGLTYEYLGEMDLAVQYVEEAAGIQRDVLGMSHPQYLLAVYNLGSLSYNAGDIEGAIRNIKIAVDGADNAYPPPHLYTGRFNGRLAQIYAENGQHELARRHAGKALGIYNQLEDVNPDWIENAVRLADIPNAPEEND